MLKEFIKCFLGYFRCVKSGIKVSVKDKVFIGKNANICGGGKIRLGKNIVIRPDVDLWCNGEKLIIDDGTEIGQRCRISIIHSLTIGKKVLLSPNVYITDCDHEYRNMGVPVIDQGVVKKVNSVIIKDGAYIGINSVIVGDVSIGKGAVVGANSVVTKNVPDYCVAVGSPARIIKKYNYNSGNWERC